MRKILWLIPVVAAFVFIAGCSLGATTSDAGFDVSVVDISTGAPLQGIQLLLVRSDEPTLQKVYQTDANGKVSIRGLDPYKTYYFNVISDGWKVKDKIPDSIIPSDAAAEGVGFKVSAGEIYPVLIKLERITTTGTGVIRGKVYDGVTGEPIANALVVAKSTSTATEGETDTETTTSSNTYSATTNSNGEYELVVAEGEYNLQVIAEGYPTESSSSEGERVISRVEGNTASGVTVYANRETTVDFHLRAGTGNVTCHLYCPDGLTKGIHITIWLDAIGGKPIYDADIDNLQNNGDVSAKVELTDVPLLPTNTTHKYVLEVTSPYFSVASDSYPQEFVLTPALPQVSIDTITLQALSATLKIKVIAKNDDIGADEFTFLVNNATALNVAGIPSRSITPTQVQTSTVTGVNYHIAYYEVPNVPAGVRTVTVSIAGTPISTGNNGGGELVIKPDSIAGPDDNYVVGVYTGSGS